MSRTGWFADTSDKSPNGYPWQPCLQLDLHCVSFDTWFATRYECEKWIKDEILGKGLYHEQDDDQKHTDNSFKFAEK